MPSDDDLDTRLVKLETNLWGPWGSNGVSGDVKSLRHDVGDLYGKQDALRGELRDGLAELQSEIKDSLRGIYKFMALIAVSVAVALLGIVGTLIAVVAG